jgi:hypothetical protein
MIKNPAIEPLIEKIMTECVRVARLSFQEQMAELKPGVPFPPTIPVGPGQLDTSSEGFEAIGKLSALYKLEPPEVRARVSRDTYAKVVLYAVGDSIMWIKDQTKTKSKVDEEPWVEPMAAQFKEQLASRLAGVKRDQTQIVPCHIFDSDQNAPSFTVGPISFYTRPDWLKTLNGEVTRTDLIEDYWSSRLSLDDLRKRTYGPESNDAIRGAYNAVTTIGPHCGSP